eukprot:TRINITY_DN6508_c0_g1_i1.p1 TRINITY_DN6508_c0_g1~~TRINITY_DN6508_c0_g1_i1.p1  ORF type:complete len:176 (+),score=12.31 TRINITY_DN6508_c0_g1_i1:61-528(+)
MDGVPLDELPLSIDLPMPLNEPDDETKDEGNNNNDQTASASIIGEEIMLEHADTEPSKDEDYTETSDPSNEEEEGEDATEQRPFMCPECGRGFTRSYDLKVHQRIHTNERPYQCRAEGCDKTFSRSSSVREHERNVHKLFSDRRITSIKRQKSKR